MKFVYLDNQDYMHTTCPVCANDDCKGHPWPGHRDTPEKRREVIILDPTRVQAAREFLGFYCSFPPEGNAAKRKARDRELVRRAARVLLAREDDPLMVRVMGRRG